MTVLDHSVARLWPVPSQIKFPASSELRNAANDEDMRYRRTNSVVREAWLMCVKRFRFERQTPAVITCLTHIQFGKENGMSPINI
jgi:hypothetical protein